jgi:hypothetical protein
MAVTPKRLYKGTPTTTVATAYTVPASTTTIVKNIILTNTTSSDAKVSVLLGGVSIVEQVTISAYSTSTIDLSAVLNGAEIIEVWQGTASACRMYISGVEVV